MKWEIVRRFSAARRSGGYLLQPCGLAAGVAEEGAFFFGAGVVKRSGTVGGFGVDVGALVDQEFQGGKMRIVLRGVVQRGGAVVGFGVDVGALEDEEFQDGGVRVAGGREV